MRICRSSFLFAAVLAVVGCAPHGARLGPVFRAMSAGDFDGAVAELERRPQPESVVWRMEYGLLLRYAGRLEESNQSFAEALRMQEDLYTISVTNEAAALVVSDAIRPYRAPEFELGFLHAYPALNYLEMGNLDGALVEVRALSEMLELRSGRAIGNDGGKPHDWALGRHLTGLIYEAGREWNNAWVAYRAALSLYRLSPPRGWDSLEPVLVESIIRTGAATGLRRPDDLYGADAQRAEWLKSLDLGVGHTASDRLAHSDGGESGDEVRQRRRSRPARLVVWQEEGLVPVKQDFHIRVPILKTEEKWNHDHIDEWSSRVGERALSVYSGSYSAPRTEVAYFLDVALPVLPQPNPRPPLRGSVHLNGDLIGSIVEAEDVEQAVRDDLRRRYPSIAVRAAARAILKALAVRGARKEGGELAGFLTNVLGAATERADTRGWSTLPSRVGLAVMDLEPGSLQIEIESIAIGGRVLMEADVPDGGWHFFSCRFF